MSMLTNAIEELKKGNFVIVTDDKSRENEADLVLAAQFMDAEKLNFLLTHGKGMICVPLAQERAEKLNLPLMVEQNKNEEYTGCAFTVSCDARNDIGSGISASDRAQTISLLADPSSSADDFVRPGHVFPLIGAEKGLEGRQGHTEAALALCKKARLEPVAVVCEILNEQGQPLTSSDWQQFATTHQLTHISVKDIITELL